MKVLLINTVCGYGSTGKICVDIAEILSESGHDVKIAYGRGKSNCKFGIKIGTDFDNKMHGVLTRVFDKHGLGSKNITRKFIKWVEEYSPDVIHLHNLHGYYLNYEILFDFLKKYNKPVIWTLHDCWTFTGHCSHFDFIGCDKWKEGCFKCPMKSDYPSSILFDNSKQNYIRKKQAFSKVSELTIVTPSKWLAQIVKQSILSEYPVRVVPNGISTDTFCHRNSSFKVDNGLSDKKIILGVASIWGPTKGYSDFLKLSKMINDDYRIVIVGATDEMIAEMPANMIGIKRTENAVQLAEIYSAADFFFNPTYQDTYPTVNLEANACGTPVITYKTCGSPEGVFCGTVVEQGDIASAYKWMQEHNDEKADVADFKEKIDRNTMIKEYVSLIEKMTKKDETFS